MGATFFVKMFSHGMNKKKFATLCTRVTKGTDKLLVSLELYSGGTNKDLGVVQND